MKKELSVPLPGAIVNPKSTRGMRKVGITKTGELVWAPLEAFPHLRRNQVACCVCGILAHKRDAVVDFEGNVYHKKCFDPIKQLPSGSKVALVG